jgi:hypothetical protein
VSPRLEIRRKAMVAAEKNLKREAAAAGRRKSGDGGSESGLGDLRFGPESPSPPSFAEAVAGTGEGAAAGAGAGGEGIRTAGERPRWRLPLSVPDGSKWRDWR